jgi:hypothetical protein
MISITNPTLIESYIREFGAWHCTAGQAAALVNTPYAIGCNNVDFEQGIQLIDNTKMTFSNAGYYNIQHSLQLHHVGGGGNGTKMVVWLDKNGTAVPETATYITVTNGQFSFVAWNFLVYAEQGDYYRLMWQTDNTSIKIEKFDAVGNIPASPCVILTVNRVS